MPVSDEDRRLREALIPIARARLDERPRAAAVRGAVAAGASSPAIATRRWRRAMVAAIAVAAATAGILAIAERPEAPERLSAPPAFARALTEPGRILHIRERSVVIGGAGAPRPHVEETWSLLDDMRFTRWRIGEGPDAEEGALGVDAATGEQRSMDYDPAKKRLAIVHYPGVRPQPRSAGDLPILRLARAVLEGRAPKATPAVVRGRPALRIPTRDATWYVARDAPVVLRKDVPWTKGRVMRIDFLVFEVLEATPENRRVLEIHPPPGTTVERITAPVRKP